MQQLLPILAGAVGGGVFTLLAVLVGTLLKARQDAAQWRRDRRLEAYAELARAYHDVIVAINSYAAELARDPAAAGATLDKARERMMWANGSVELVSPPMVRDGTDKLTEHVIRVVHELKRTELVAGPQYLDLMLTLNMPMNESYEVVMRAARRDLGVG